MLVAFRHAEAREDYLVSSQLFQQAKGFKGANGSSTARLDGELFSFFFQTRIILGTCAIESLINVIQWKQCYSAVNKLTAPR